MTDERRNRDIALADACVAGSSTAWAELVQRHRTSVRYAILHTLRAHGAPFDDAVVDDLESATFLRLVVDDFRRLRQYRGQASLEGWLKVLASNAAVDALRRRRRTVPIGPGYDLDLPDPQPSAQARLESEQLAAGLRALWQELPEADAEFVEMYFVLELGFDEIARRTGATLGALYARKNRIRKKLVELAEAGGWFDALDTGTE